MSAREPFASSPARAAEAGKELLRAAFGTVSQAVETMVQRGGDAVEDTLDQVAALREELQPFGYDMSSVAVKMTLIPEVEVEFHVKPGASLENFNEEEELTDVQRVILRALERKVSLDDMVARHGMNFQSLKVVLTVPPHVEIKLGFDDTYGGSSGSGSDAEEEATNDGIAQVNQPHTLCNTMAPAQFPQSMQLQSLALPVQSAAYSASFSTLALKHVRP